MAIGSGAGEAVSGLVRHSAGLGRLEWWRHCDATEKLKGVEGGKETRRKAGARPAGSHAGRLTGAPAAANHKKIW